MKTPRQARMSLEDAKRLIKELAAENSELEKRLWQKKLEVESLRAELQFARGIQHRVSNRQAWGNV